MNDKALQELVTTKVKRDTRNKLKILAALEAVDMPEYLEVVINKKYETK